LTKWSSSDGFSCCRFIMATLRSRCGHYILPSGFYLSSFFPRLISVVVHWMSTILPHMIWPCANIECISEMCCTRLADNTGRKNLQKWPFGHYRTILSGYIFATEACIDNRKKILKQQYLLHTSSQYGELWPTSG